MRDPIARNRCQVPNPDEIIRLVNLRKVYAGERSLQAGGRRGAPKVALKSMTFGVNVGECFGYLGM